MKTFTKSFFFVISLVLFFNSCSEDDSEIVPEPIVEGKVESFSLNIEEGLNLDYSLLSAVSYDGSTSISPAGEFDLKTRTEEEDEEIPLLITKDDEVLFGYYPKFASGGNITPENILLFFFSMHPDIGIRGWDNAKLFADIKSLSDKAALQAEVSESLDNNQSPLDNPEFIALLKKNVRFLITTDSNKRAAKEYIQDFQFTFKRDGRLEVPTSVPLFAVVGVEIKNTSSGEFLVKDHLLESKSLVLNATSLATWIGTKLFPETAPPVFSAFQFDTDGAYEVKFTNGKGNSELDNYVKAENYKNFLTTVLGQVMPKGLGQLYKNHGDCFKAVMDINTELKVDFANFLISPPNEEQVIALIGKNIANTSEVLVQCAMEGDPKKYFSLLLKYGIKKLDAVKEVSELTFFSRDFFASAISGQEVRYYSNDVSFGLLDLENTSGYEFEGEKGKNFTYASTIKEEKVWYEVHRSVLPPKSEFKRKTDSVPAADLPFEATILKGDAKIEDPNVETNSQGILQVIMEMGVDTSAVEIKPMFDLHGISPQKVELEPGNPLKGVWKVKTWQGQSLGSRILVYSDERCPSIATGADYLYSSTFTFSDESYSLVHDESGINFNLSLDANCQIFNDNPDTEVPRVFDEYGGNYEFKNNQLTLEDEDGYTSGVFTIEFLNDNKTQFVISGDPHRDIWVKQE